MTKISPFYLGRRRNRRRLGEFELIRELTADLTCGSEVVIGPGDDASAVQPPPQKKLLLQTTDMLVEGVDFHKEWGTPYMMGMKATTANLSDIAAMGGRPRWAHVALAIPPSWSHDDVYAITQGIKVQAETHGVSVIGGDLSATSGPLVICLMISGEVPASQVIRRSGAKSGDIIWVSGTLGNAAGGLRLFQAGAQRLSDHSRFAFLTPQPQVKLGMVCAESCSVHAMIDISDGLVGDLGHILTASNAGAIIAEKKLPVHGSLRKLGRKQGWDLLNLVLRGGEDFELLGCSPPELFEDFCRLVQKRTDETITAIGRITDTLGLKLMRSHSRIEEIEPRAYEHTI